MIRPFTEEQGRELNKRLDSLRASLAALSVPGPVPLGSEVQISTAIGEFRLALHKLSTDAFYVDYWIHKIWHVPAQYTVIPLKEPAKRASLADIESLMK